MTDQIDTHRGALRLMVDPVFGGLFWGKLLSGMGAWMHSIVAAIVVYQLTGSALLVGLISVAEFAPQLVFSPLSGKWADQGHTTRLILLGQLMCFTGTGVLALWMWRSPMGDRATTVAVLAATLVVGFGFVIGGPAMQSIIPSLVRTGELATAMALNTAPMTLGRIAGPALGAYLTVQFGSAVAFAAAASTNVAFIVLIAASRLPPRRRGTVGTDYSVRSALVHVRRDRRLLLLLIVVAAAGFGSEPSTTLAPAIADNLNGGPALIGHLTTGFGMGAAFGLVVIPTLNRRISTGLSSSIGLWLMVLGLAAVAVSPTVALVLAAFAITGVGFSWTLTGTSTLIQERAPDHLRGRIMALWMVAFIGCRPIAATLVGGIADARSSQFSLLLTALLLAAVATLCRPAALDSSSMRAAPTPRRPLREL